MPPKTKKRAARSRPQKSAVAFALKLKTLRKLVSGFDAASWNKIRATKPRTASGKKRRAAALSKVSRTYSKLKPYLQRSHKIVKSKSKKTIAALAQYANVPKVKGLRAVPMATISPKKFRARVDKAGRVQVSVGKRYKELVYRFPKRPRSQKIGGKFITAGEHAIQMLETMLPTLKPGLYIFQTRSQDLLFSSFDKGSLVSELRRLVYGYEKDSPGFMELFIGVKYLARASERAQKFKEELLNARSEAGKRRILARRESAAKEARRLGRVSKRARATGRR